MPENTISKASGCRDIRDNRGRFLPGTVPPKSPGRPPGPSSVQVRAATLATEKLEKLLGKAVDIIDESLDNGEITTATWLIDRLRPARTSDFIALSDQPKLETRRDILAASKATLENVVRGELSLANARSYLDLLERFAGMKALEEIDSLRAKLRELENETRAPGLRMPEHMRPTWGRFRRSENGVSG